MNPERASGPPPIASAVPAGTRCARHANIPATGRCVDCAACSCDACRTVLPDGTTLCPDCLAQRTKAATVATFAPPATTATAKLKLRDRSNASEVRYVPATVAPVLALEHEPRCVQHPTAAAIATCDTCQGLLCATCMFEVPGGLHLCPTCAMRARNPLSTGRLWSVIISLILAAIATAAFIVIQVGLLAEIVNLDSEEAMLVFGLLVALLWFLFPLAGIALSFGAMDKKLGNPPLIWVAAIANVLLAGSFVVMSMMGDSS